MDREQYIRDHIDTMSYKEMGEVLGMSASNVGNYVRAHNIPNTRLARLAQEREERDAYITEHYTTMRNYKIAEHIGKDIRFIRFRARQLGLPLKPKELYDEDRKHTEEACRKHSETYRKLIRDERRRESWGLERKTTIRIKHLTDQQKSFRYRARQHKYILDENVYMRIGYDANTKRVERMENFGKRIGFKFYNEKAKEATDN